MTENILEAVLNFTGGTIVSGLTWDLMKGQGNNLVQLFKNIFTKKSFFETEEECERFFKEIIIKTPNSKKTPLRDVKNIYEDIVEIDNDDFIVFFEEWIKRNLDDFIKIAKSDDNRVKVNINSQTNSGSGQIINAGIINNYR